MTPFVILKRCLSTSSNLSAAIKHVTVIGGGLMGAGIAQVAAQTGHKVTVVEVNEKLLNKAQTDINTNLRRVAKKLFKDNSTDGDKFVSSAMSRLSGSTSVAEAVKDTDLVIEAIIEKMDLKHKLFKVLDEAAPAKTIFSSNTSSFSISEIASVTNRKDRFAGLHYFYPVPLMKFLEITRIPETSGDTYNALIEFGKNIGHVTIDCKDTPGFIMNRLLVPYINEAMKMYERGVASAEDIDTAMKLGAGYLIGPFYLADKVGLDVLYYILQGWHEKYPENPIFEPSKLLKKMVEQGKLGIKTGEGFYKYDKK